VAEELTIGAVVFGTPREVPVAMPGLVWNTMMSMPGGWFFVVASEAISVGDVQIALPGVGSYVARAIQERDLAAVGWAIVAMTIAIIIYDQLLFPPMVVWAHKFRFEQTAAQIVPKSVVLELFRRSRLLRRFDTPVVTALHKVARARLSWPRRFHGSTRWSPPRPIVDFVWHGLLTAAPAMSYGSSGDMPGLRSRWTTLRSPRVMEL